MNGFRTSISRREMLKTAAGLGVASAAGLGSASATDSGVETTEPELLWEFEAGTGDDLSPTVVDGTVFTGSWDNTVFAVDGG